MNKNKDIEIIDDLDFIDNIENRAEIEKENVELVSKELNLVKCPKCGYMNFELAKRCTKCRYDLDDMNKSCPKCGKINEKNKKKCDCGFNFNKRKRTVLGNFIIALLVMILLFVAFNFYGDVVEKYDMVIKVVFIYFAFVFLCKTFISSNPEEGFGAEVEMLEKYKRKENPKVIRNLLIILGAFAAIGFLVYYYYFK